LIEVASANGNLLLNVGPTNEGEIPQKSLDRFASVGKWMQTNGEAIYGTKAWKLQGEQSVIEKKVEKETAGVNTMKDVLNDATSQKTPADIRFTSKGNNVYVFARSWRETFVTVKSLGIDKGNGKVSEVELLGYNRKINWEQEANALRIEVPNAVDSLIPIYTFRVKFK
jgi:alpha-L-fucosidase